MLVFSGKPKLSEKTTTTGQIRSLSLSTVGFFGVAMLVMNLRACNIHIECIREVFLDVFQIPGMQA